MYYAVIEAAPFYRFQYRSISNIKKSNFHQFNYFLWPHYNNRLCTNTIFQSTSELWGQFKIEKENYSKMFQGHSETTKETSFLFPK